MRVLDSEIGFSEVKQTHRSHNSIPMDEGASVGCSSQCSRSSLINLRHFQALSTSRQRHGLRLSFLVFSAAFRRHFLTLEFAVLTLSFRLYNGRIINDSIE